MRPALLIVDGGCFFVLSVMDAFVDTFIFVGFALLRLPAWLRRLHFLLFRAASPLTEWNLGWLTIGIGLVCALARDTTVGGRDVFLDASRFLVGNAQRLRHIGHPCAEEVALQCYGWLLVPMGAALLIGMKVRRSWPELRELALLLCQYVWGWTAFVVLPFHFFTIAGMLVGAMAATSWALYRRVPAEGRRRDE